MVIETLFSDHVVNASDLRSNQKRWLEEALKRPVTVNYSRRQLAIMNREQARDLFMRVRFAEVALAVCRDLDKRGIFETFPWLESLSKKERSEFREEILDCFAKSSKTGRWNAMEDLIADWKATAEAKQHPEIVRALRDEGTPAEYVTLSE
jgi:hypothetical protein